MFLHFSAQASFTCLHVTSFFAVKQLESISLILFLLGFPQKELRNIQKSPILMQTILI
jgi:hypothetical protein